MMIFVCLLLNAIGFKSSILGCIKYFYAGGLAAFAYESRNKIKRIKTNKVRTKYFLSEENS